MSLQLTPAAQYLRMSTEHQQYSLSNQAAAIQQYAEQHGFEIVESYIDAGRSGVVLRRRTGLQKLLADVLGGQHRYQAVLVYDVSRWGRFQDTDEAAHYEFLCKRAGICLHYCAEPFANDGTLPSSLIKALKRSMAAEYSRELGVKVFQGKRAGVLRGFWVGGRPGYAWQRLLVAADGSRKLLEPGQHKLLTSDRTVLVPGNSEHIAIVRRIFYGRRGTPHWDVCPTERTRTRPALLCFSNANYSEVMDMFVLPCVNLYNTCRLRLDHPGLAEAVHLNALQEFCDACLQVAARGPKPE